MQTFTFEKRFLYQTTKNYYLILVYCFCGLNNH